MRSKIDLKPNRYNRIIQMVWIEGEDGTRHEVEMKLNDVLYAVKWLVKERERIRLKSIRARRAKGIPARNFRPKPDPDAPAPEKPQKGRPRKEPSPPTDPDAPKRGRGRPRKNPVPDIQVEIPTESPAI